MRSFQSWSLLQDWKCLRHIVNILGKGYGVVPITTAKTSNTAQTICAPVLLHTTLNIFQIIFSIRNFTWKVNPSEADIYQQITCL
ncbi:hypothetical protein CSB45_10935 [candidate division KSB3 bacterium]|uniref:Uncharacterized protein n=1 Tax=candidate division KSB3 bacterium TaxID=2044937 RepID=A0A2G6E382_9BACT|nr:MAG: hypothetical protein CSB45_10935 [candidate division KSB3 bacterium]PIE29074.1 MAG: hypothetical protein CSA57_10670 [candidate division KSB3 bacterium]